MNRRESLITLLNKPEVLLAEACVLISVVFLVWGREYIGIILGGPAVTEEGQHVLALTIIVVQALVVFIIASIFYILFLHYSLKNRTQVIAEGMVSDLVISREQFKLLYDNSSVPYFLMDDEGKIHSPNKAALRFFGGTLEECEKAGFYDFLGEHTASQPIAQIVRTKVDRGIPVSREEMRVRSFSGTVRWAQVSIYSLSRSSPLPFKHVVTLLDITKEKESDEVKTDFFLLASHQLRTPMTTIKWYIDYLLHTKSLDITGVVREYLEEIDRGNERMIELVTTLLTVSRIEMGTLLPDFTQVHADEVVEDILKELESDMKGRRITCKKESHGDDKLVTDRTMLRIVIHNLLTNAVKYTPSGGEIRVVARYEAHECTVAVSDTGCGIPLEEQERIFEKMFRASNARKMSTNGTGLGLYLSREFIKKLGGDLSFSSASGKGATFTIVMPRVAPSA